MDAQTIEDLVSSKKDIAQGSVEGEEEFEELKRDLRQTTLKLLTPSPVVPNISQRMTLRTTILVVLREDDTKDPPNQRTFQHFFGGGPPKRLEKGPNEKPC